MKAMKADNDTRRNFLLNVGRNGKTLYMLLFALLLWVIFFNVHLFKRYHIVSAMYPTIGLPLERPSQNVPKKIDKDAERIPIIELLYPAGAMSKNETSCPTGLVSVGSDIHLPRNITHAGRKIPRIIHLTSKTRCVKPIFYEIIKLWRFEGHSVYFHDDDAVERLFNQDWSEDFPGLQQAILCLTGGAAKADLWRYLALWEYGGIYTDIDNKPTGLTIDTISPEYDSFYLLDDARTLSQWFMATSRRHPLMKTTLNDAITKFRGTQNVMNNVPARSTGPRILKDAFTKFVQAGGDVTFTGSVEAGNYIGENNRSVTVIGTLKNSKEYVNRQGIDPYEKIKFLNEMNMTHFFQHQKGDGHVKAVNDKGETITCEMHIQNVLSGNFTGNSTKPKDMYRIESHNTKKNCPLGLNCN